MLIYSSKRLSFIIIFFLNFLTGIEYAVILPTALQYLQKYGGGQIQLGLCLSAYSFSSLFSSPIMGRFSDKTNNTKLIMLLANLWQIAGNLMYFMGINTTFIICGRLVAGALFFSKH
jgi:ceroid-lipofuscinosis MFS transporter 7